MNEPKPLNAAARAALEAYGQATDAPLNRREGEAAMRGALERFGARPRNIRFAFVFVASCAVGMLITGQLMSALRTSAPREQLGEVVQLRSGPLRLSTHGIRREVVTAELSVVWTEGRVLMEAMPGQTVLWVEEGTVVYRDATGEHPAKQGDRIVVPVELAVAPSQNVPGCEQLPSEKMDECIGALAQGSGLGAQTALFELAVRAHERRADARAEGFFREYQRRFPDGVLGPEVSLGLMLELRHQGRTVDARVEAAAFVSRFPADPRASDVGQWSKQIR